jgi:hypothetical protein
MKNYFTTYYIDCVTGEIVTASELTKTEKQSERYQLFVKKFATTGQIGVEFL